MSLFQATHLMDPANFQVSLDGMPGDLVDYSLVVAGIEYDCEILFPDDHPDRIYCWGPAPKSGETVPLQIFLPDEENPILEIEFKVPGG